MLHLGGLLLCLSPSVPETASDAAPPGGSNHPIDVGVEVRGYPAGVIPALRARFSLAPHFSLLGYVEANFARRRDLGEFDDERGEGFGGGLGLRAFLRPDHVGWHGGARVDVFYLPIRFTDEVEGGPDITGETETVVVQPSVHAGYTFDFDGNLLELTLAFGREINVVENGPPVGEDFILLWGLAFALE